LSCDGVAGVVCARIQTVLQVPLSNVRGACSENGQPSGCIVSMHGKVELHIIGLLVVLYSVVCMTSAPGLQWTANCRGPNSELWGTPTTSYKLHLCYQGNSGAMTVVITITVNFVPLCTNTLVIDRIVVMVMF